LNTFTSNNTLLQLREGNEVGEEDSYGVAKVFVKGQMLQNLLLFIIAGANCPPTPLIRIRNSHKGNQITAKLDLLDYSMTNEYPPKFTPILSLIAAGEGGHYNPTYCLSFLPTPRAV
jgi:hypothetical protein